MKHRRSYIEVTDLKALCSDSSHPDLDTKNTLMVTLRLPDCVDCLSMSVGEQAQAAEQDQTDIYADSEQDEDSGSEHSNQGQSKRTRKVRKLRTSLDASRTLPDSFRPLVRNGEVQFEIWVVAMVNRPAYEGGSGQAVAGVVVNGDTTVTIPGPTLRQAQDSAWADQAGALLDSNIMRCFVREQVAVGRIGIDFRRILEEEKERRKSRRCMR
ncbi:hypothetical protein BGZ75_008911 [Mortierella antarctica]|nr:hypothetical protein BGZ75_008911 [Mortierella antarctica]